MSARESQDQRDMALTSSDWIGDWGRAHIAVKAKLGRMSYRNARKFLRAWGYGRRAQDAMIHDAKSPIAEICERRGKERGS